jgi:hypothetical protein
MQRNVIHQLSLHYEGRATMSKTGRTNHRRGTRGQPKVERQISVRSVRRDPPDLRKLSRAVIAMALRDAELEGARAVSSAAEAQADATTEPDSEQEVAND